MRVEQALNEMGSSVFVGIFCTKVIGISILGFAPSPIFTLYYFRMYMIMILVCAFYGLCVTPVLLMIFGSDYTENRPKYSGGLDQEFLQQSQDFAKKSGDKIEVDVYKK